MSLVMKICSLSVRLHRLYRTRRSYAFLFRLPKKLGMKIGTFFDSNFVFFHLDAMSIGPSILSNASDLPRDLHVRFVGLDCEVVVLNFFGNDSLCELPQNSELIAVVVI